MLELWYPGKVLYEEGAKPDIKEKRAIVHPYGISSKSFKPYKSSKMSKAEYISFIIIAIIVLTPVLIRNFGGNNAEYLFYAIVGTEVLLGVCLIGLIFLCVSFPYLVKKVRCKTLVTAECVYITKEIVSVKRSARSKMHVPIEMWIMHFQYCYDGKCYYPDCVGIPATRSKPLLSSTREVLINSQKPKESLLEHPQEDNTYIGFSIFGVIIIALALFLASLCFGFGPSI